MTTPMSIRYATRSLLRHKRRTFLSITGIGVGCAVCLFLIGFVSGESEMMMRAAAQTGTGHAKIVPAEWLKSREHDLRLSEWASLRERIREMDNIQTVAPHVATDALLAMGTRTAGVTMTGVDPEAEPTINRLVRSVSAGNYLRSDGDGETVIGKGLARRLDVSVGDEVMVTASGADGQLRSAMLRVRGIVATGSRNLDDALCHVVLSEAGEISGLPGATELSVLLRDPGLLHASVRRMRAAIPDGQAVVTWDQVAPELAAAVRVDETWTHLMVGVVVTVVFLGIASAQLAAVLERRKEFAVLSAVGMKGRRLLCVMLAEGLMLGLAGAVLGLLLGVPLVYWISVAGIDFSRFMDQADFTISNIMIDPVIYGVFGWWLVPVALGISLLATLLSSIYPAWYAAGVDPADALRVDQ